MRQIILCVEPLDRHTDRIRDGASFGMATGEVMFERVDTRGRNVRVVDQVELSVEIQGRIVAELPTDLVVMLKWVQPGLENVRMHRNVERGVEVRVWIAPFFPA